MISVFDAIFRVLFNGDGTSIKNTIVHVEESILLFVKKTCFVKKRCSKHVFFKGRIWSNEK